jgi:hypothetical protein
MRVCRPALRPKTILCAHEAELFVDLVVHADLLKALRDLYPVIVALRRGYLMRVRIAFVPVCLGAAPAIRSLLPRKCVEPRTEPRVRGENVIPNEPRATDSQQFWVILKRTDELEKGSTEVRDKGWREESRSVTALCVELATALSAFGRLRQDSKQLADIPVTTQRWAIIFAKMRCRNFILRNISDGRLGHFCDSVLVYNAPYLDVALSSSHVDRILSIVISYTATLIAYPTLCPLSSLPPPPVWPLLLVLRLLTSR